MSLHLVARAGRAQELAQRLRERGFDAVRVLPDDHVVLSASPEELRERLGVSSDDAIELPTDVETLVERAYRPMPPDRLEPE